MSEKLYAVLVGGWHPRSNIELHDLRFVIAASIWDTVPQLKASWWGTPETLHIDAYCELAGLDGYRIELSNTPQADGPKLYFINVGYYLPESFAEHHAYHFMIGDTKLGVWKRALKAVEEGSFSKHKDSFAEVDDIIDVGANLFSQGRHIHLIKDESFDAVKPDIVAEYMPFSKR